MTQITSIHVSRTALKQLKKVPVYINVKLQAWIDNVAERGLNAVRKIPGFHDEPLKGTRAGQRSIRLSRAYRAIYIIKKDGTIEFVEILEVSKHEY